MRNSSLSFSHNFAQISILKNFAGFPIAFFPTDLQERIENVSKLGSGTAVKQGGVENAIILAAQETLLENNAQQKISVHHHVKSDFWDILVKLDATFGLALASHSAGTPRKISAGAPKQQVENFFVISKEIFIYIFAKNYQKYFLVNSFDFFLF